MKRFVALFLSLCCTTLLFSGCKQPPVDDPGENTSGQTQDTQPTTQPTTKPTEPVIVEDIEGPLAQYVQTAIKETIVFPGDRFGNKQSTPVRIPKLLPFSEDATACQAEIQQKFDSLINKIRKEHADGHTSATAFIDYSAYVNDSVLSVVIHQELMFDVSLYSIYNFDTETGKQLDTAELMSKLQITDYAEKFAQAAKKAYEEKYQHSQNKDNFYHSQLAATISKENIDKAVPYVAEAGKVMVVINIYAIAGAAYYPEAIPLS